MAEVFKQIARGSSPIIISPTWCTIAQSQPGVSFPFSDVSAYSNSIAGAYEGATLSTKFLFTISLSASSTYTITFAAPGNQTAACSPSYSAISAGRSPAATMRLRPIISSYSLSGVTWNSFFATPPTMGAAITKDLCTYYGQVNTSQFGFSGSVAPFTITTTSSPSIFGFVVDVTTTLGTFGGALANPTYSSISASIPQSSTTSIAPYAIKW